MHRTRIKLCGITRREDFLLAADLEIDFVGFVFVKSSPRCVTPEQAREMCGDFTRHRLPVRVGVFADQKSTEVLAICRAARMDMAQLHGSESTEWCTRLGVPYWKAVCDPDLIPEYVTHSDHPVLLDASGVDRSGKTLKLCAARKATEHHSRVILAGGISPENLSSYLALSPWGIDFSSSVESMPGVKDSSKVEKLVQTVRRYSNECR